MRVRNRIARRYIRALLVHVLHMMSKFGGFRNDMASYKIGMAMLATNPHNAVSHCVRVLGVILRKYAPLPLGQACDLATATTWSSMASSIWAPVCNRVYNLVSRYLNSMEDRDAKAIMPALVRTGTYDALFHMLKLPKHEWNDIDYLFEQPESHTATFLRQFLQYTTRNLPLHALVRSEISFEEIFPPHKTREHRQQRWAWMFADTIECNEREYYNASVKAWLADRIDCDVVFRDGIAILGRLLPDQFYVLSQHRYVAVAFDNVISSLAQSHRVGDIGERYRRAQVDNQSTRARYLFDWHKWLPRRGTMCTENLNRGYCTNDNNVSLAHCVLMSDVHWTWNEIEGWMMDCSISNIHRLRYARMMHSMARVYFLGAFILSQLHLLPVYIVIEIIDMWYPFGGARLTEKTRVAIVQSARDEVRRVAEARRGGVQ